MFVDGKGYLEDYAQTDIKSYLGNALQHLDEEVRLKLECEECAFFGTQQELTEMMSGAGYDVQCESAECANSDIRFDKAEQDELQDYLEFKRKNLEVRQQIQPLKTQLSNQTTAPNDYIELLLKHFE